MLLGAKDRFERLSPELQFTKIVLDVIVLRTMNDKPYFTSNQLLTDIGEVGATVEMIDLAIKRLKIGEHPKRFRTWVSPGMAELDDKYKELLRTGAFKWNPSTLRPESQILRNIVKRHMSLREADLKSRTIGQLMAEFRRKQRKGYIKWEKGK